MMNPLNKRFKRDIKTEFGKYFVLFLFLVGMIGLISGFLVSAAGLIKAYDESFEKYNIEHGNFILKAEMPDSMRSDIETAQKVTVYDNFFKEEDSVNDSVIRIFKDRREVDKICLMKGEMPDADDEIAVDRMWADNNEIASGDKITVDGRDFTVSGLVALSDYSALFRSTSDLMFDSQKFCVAVVTDECFEGFPGSDTHFCYSWKYDKEPSDDREAKQMGDDLLKKLAECAAMNNIGIDNYIPAYSNQAIQFTGNDFGNDSTMMKMFLYILTAVVAFMFAISAKNTIEKESSQIGTLLASGYTRGELLSHYMTMPMLVTLFGAIVGNVLGYTVFEKLCADLYYGSYSLPTYESVFSAEALIQTTIVPLAIVFVINFVVLLIRLQFPISNFMRGDLTRRRKKKAFKLNTKIPIMHRFRLRIIFQNIPGYVVLFLGIAFANVILLFGTAFDPLLSHYQDVITENMLCDYTYILKLPEETADTAAEKFSALSFKTQEQGSLKPEDVTVYGAADNSSYVKCSFDKNEKNGVVVSSAYANKFELEKGDEVTVNDPYSDDSYTFRVTDVMYYPGAVAAFMPIDEFNEIFDKDKTEFTGYFSDKELTDLTDGNIATRIGADDMTKTSRQLKKSMGSMANVIKLFSVVLFVFLMYFLSKIVIEKNTHSISVIKILGYSGSEINSLYILVTSVVTVASVIITIPLVNVLMKQLIRIVMSKYPGYMEYFVPGYVYVEIAALGILAYIVTAILLTAKIKRVSMAQALAGRL